MNALRCTAKLRRKLGLGLLPEPEPGSAVLGDWYAHLLTVDRQPLVLAVSERSFLAVVLPARDMKNLRRHVLRAVHERLERIGIDEDAIRDEIARLAPLAFAATRSRSVLGMINEFILDLKALADHPRGRDWSCSQFEEELAARPCSPLGMESPVQAARRLLGVEGRVIRGPWKRGVSGFGPIA